MTDCCCSERVLTRGVTAPTALWLACILLGPASPARAQPGPRTPPPPTQIDPAIDMGPAVPAPADAAAPAPAPSAEPATPPTLAGDRLYIDAGLEAILTGDLRRAEALFARAAVEASSPQMRTTAALLAQRTRALASRRAQLPAPSLQAARPPARRSSAPSARPVLLLTTTVLGVAGWGWMLPMAVGVEGSDSARATVGLYMVTAAGSFAVPYLLTRNQEVTWAQSNLAYYGGTRGLEYGLLVSNVVFGRDGGNIDDFGNRKAFAGSMLLGSIGGVAAGSWWARHGRMSAGDARTVAAWGDYGLLGGFVAGHVLGLDELTGDVGQQRLDARARSMAASGMVGTILGLTVGRRLSLARSNTWGDGEVMRGGGLLGALAGVTTAAVLDYEDSSRATLASVAVGAGLGMVGGDALVRHTDFSMGESILIDLALVSGGLGAAGVTYLASGDADPAAYLVAATLGAGLAGGFAYHLLKGGGSGPGRAARPPAIALVPRIGPGGQRALTLQGSF
jgi:hypothetical protein